MSDDSIQPFGRQFNTHTDVELLGLYLIGKIDVIKLSDKLQEKLNRLECCRDLYYEKMSRHEVVRMLQRLTWTKRNEEKTQYKISQQQAYRDFDDMVELFSATANRTGLNFYVEKLLKNIDETRRQAMADRDGKTAAACDKNFILALEKFFGNLEAEEYKKMRPGNISIDFIPESQPPLPDDWEAQVDKIISMKKRRLDISDAQIIDDEPPGDGPAGDD